MAEMVDDVAGKIHRGLLGSQERLLMGHSAFYALREAIQPPCDHQCRDIIQKEVIEAFTALL